MTTTDKEGEPVVAKLSVKVGDHYIVMLPDGQLVARLQADAIATERRFQPATKKQMLSRLKTRFPSFNFNDSRHFVYAYNTSKNFYAGTSRILETMLPGVERFAESLGMKTHDPEVPLVVIMFRTEKEFQNSRKMPSGVVAYYDPTTNEIVMYEESPLWKVKPELAIQDSISTIAHEGAHQILHNIGVQHRLARWPMWLSEGLAEYLAPTTFGKSLRWKGAGEINDMRMFELEMYLKGREAATSSGQLVEHTAAAGRLSSTGYATAWALTHYLAKQQQDAFEKYVQAVSRLGPFQTTGELKSSGRIDEQLKQFCHHFGKDTALLESKVVQHLKTLPYRDPFFEWPHWVATIELSDRRREANVFQSPDLAVKWSNEQLEAVPAHLSQGARNSVREFSDRATAEVHARLFLTRRTPDDLKKK